MKTLWVVVDKLSKVAHFIHVKYMYKDVNIEDIFMKEIFRMHGVPKVIALDRDTKFIGKLWKSLFKFLGTWLHFSTAYHPQMEWKTKRVN